MPEEHTPYFHATYSEDHGCGSYTVTADGDFIITLTGMTASDEDEEIALEIGRDRYNNKR